MTIKSETQSKPEAENRLLSSEESGILSQIASMEQPHSSRAQALLAINEGTSQAEAGREAGLTKGQLRYWLGKFRKERMSIFPVELLEQAQPEDDAPQILEVAPDPEEAGETQQDVEQKEAAPKAKKKTKKAQKTKKEKKTKRKKKTKKGKKSTKKTKEKRSKKKKGAKGKSSKKNKKKGKK